MTYADTEAAKELHARSHKELLIEYQELLQLVKGGATVDDCLSSVNSFVRGGFSWTVLAKGTPMNFWRARAFPPELQGCGFIRDLSYPPAQLASAGRANRARSQVMYVANHPDTAIRELSMFPGQRFVIIQYACTELNLSHVGIFGNRRTDLISRATQSLPEAIREVVRAQGARTLTELHKRLGKLFTSEDKSIYPLSEAITENLLTFDHSDGLIYPSNRQPNTYNLALKPVAADHRLRPVAAWVGDVQAANELGKCERWVHRATSAPFGPNGEITWHQAGPANSPAWAAKHGT